MSAGGAFGGSRGLAPRPPEKGVFPLDHFNECKQVKDDYMACLAAHAADAAPCAALAKSYLTCRMDRNLMARQDLADLGIGPDGAVDGSGGGAPQPPPPPQASAATTQRSPPETPNTARRASGFVAGVRPSSSTGAS